MTELIIDGIQAVLPQSFTVQVKRENPLITKNGEYTYDVTLDLSNPINADLYKHLNRLNSVAEVKTKRSAILMADNRVYCNGTELVTGWTDKSVTIQIASGNSELNYVIGGEREIASLTTMPDTDFTTTAEADLGDTYPTVSVCYPPVFDKQNGVVANRWGVWFELRSPCVDFFNENPKFAQPFLCAYIKELLQAIGYRLESNQIEDTPYKHVYLVQVAHSSSWSQMLPGWTVADFLAQIEMLFNGVFVVDNRHKTVSFRFRGSYFAGCQSVHITSIDDAYEAEVDEEPQVEDLANSNVSFKFDDSEFWRWQSLSEDVMKYAKKETIPTSFCPDVLADRIYMWFMDKAHRRTDTIYTDAMSGNQYLFVSDTPPTGSPDWPLYRLVNRFEHLFDTNNKSSYELEIVPATLEKVEFQFKEKNPSGNSLQPLFFDIPTVASPGKLATEPSGSLPDMIVNNVTSQKASKSNIQLAIYSGLQTVDCYDSILAETDYPLPYIDTFYVRYNNVGGGTEVKLSKAVATLRLKDFLTNIYQGSYDIDFVHGIKLSSFDPNVYNPRIIFEIRNKRYICADIEYTLDADGRKGAWTGTFYPIRISDTEADARWILTDGKWRDGGVWLDNGRWLDD